MAKIQILDCTLRDGGYINDFAFGEYGIKTIISQLAEANVDIIECGFLEDGEYDKECSIFTTVEQIAPFIPKNRGNSMYVAMACYGEYNLSQLSPYDGTSIDGIRVTFHYNEIDDALYYCQAIKDKGYKVFVQPVGTTSYTDEQLLSLIHRVNELKPYSFYLVDTLGLMHQQDVLRFYYLINHNLDKHIQMGFHSHNNLQLSYSNCQMLANLETDRIISLDSSVNGMGRGAGNLNTELIANYINEHHGKRYEIEPLLEIVDEFIAKIRKKFEWGYSVPYYLAAINGCHPNYASYLSNKQTLNVKSIGAILRMIEPENRALYNKQIIEEKYLEYQSREIDDSSTIADLRRVFSGRNVLLIAPGASLNEYADDIVTLAKEQDCITLSVTFVPHFIDCDYTFLSNLRRYKTTFNPTKKKIQLIHTSNIETEENEKFVVNYSSLLNDVDGIMDNASMMALELLYKLGVNTVYLAGLDGYKAEGSNYYQERLVLNQDKDNIELINSKLSKKISDMSKKLKIEFVTPSLYNK